MYLTLVIASQFENRLKSAIGPKAIQAFLKPSSVRFCKVRVVRLMNLQGFYKDISQHHEDILSHLEPKQ